MIVKTLQEIIYESFHISECYVLGQNRKGKNNFFSTVGKPRSINGFLYLMNGEVLFTLPSGQKIHVKKGEVVYLPPFVEYNSIYSNCYGETIDTILIDLMFRNDNNEDLFLPDQLQVFLVSENIQNMFLRALDLYSRPIRKTAAIKSIVYSLLSNLGSKEKNAQIEFGAFRSIYDGIMYMENNIKQELSIEELADMCNMSPGHFRKLFKAYSGLSPIQFRIQKKIDIAKELLISESQSILEISNYLGFENVTYFCKLFKQVVGKSPKSYQKAYRKIGIEESAKTYNT